MDGLIVKEPYATQLVTGAKKYEYRSQPLSRHKKHRRVFILNKGRVLGTVVFDKDSYNKDDNIYKWHVLESKQFSPYMKYQHKKGCIIWINDVDISEETF